MAVMPTSIHSTDLDSSPSKIVFKIMDQNHFPHEFFDPEDDDIFKLPMSSTTNTTSDINEEIVSFNF